MAGTHTFSFDRVFGPDVRQVDVFHEVAKPIVDGRNIITVSHYFENRSYEWFQWYCILLRLDG